jgi:hypothetical protein
LYQWAFYHNQHQLGRTGIAGLLFVNLYFYILNQQRFRAGQAMNSSPAASPARCMPFISIVKMSEICSKVTTV